MRLKWLFCEAKRAFPPTWRVQCVIQCGTRVWKRQNNQGSFGICGIRSIWLQVPSFPVLAPACTAVRFGLLLSTLSRLTHILLLSTSSSKILTVETNSVGSFSPDLESNRMRETSLGKRAQNNPPRHLRHLRLSVAVAGVFLVTVLAPACAAFRFGLQLPSRSPNLIDRDSPGGSLSYYRTLTVLPR
jgi:hypothetical protein